MVNKQVVVIGGGAAGMMAAGRAAEAGASVLLLEKTDGLGKKVLISGKTRCNVTNSRELDDFIRMYGPNGRFLYGAFHRFFRDDLLPFLERYGVPTKTERGGRIFPASDNAGDVVGAFTRYLTRGDVRVLRLRRATRIKAAGGIVSGVATESGDFPATAVILAAGGASFPETGSAGDGFALAADLGHRLVPLKPALVPLVVRETDLARSMQGVSLRNVRLTSFRRPAAGIDPALVVREDYGRGLGIKKPPETVIESRLGEMIFTHFGISGPIVLQMSLAIVTALEQSPVSISIDLKPGLSHEQLDQRLRRDFDRYGRRGYGNILKGLLPHRMIAPFIQLTGIPAAKPGNQLSAAERNRLRQLLKSLRFNIKSSLPLSAAMVTAGGVALDEIDPRTMASRLARGLYLCGEVIDIDADTGGYNLQAAFSTGYVAGESAAAFAADL